MGEHGPGRVDDPAPAGHPPGGRGERGDGETEEDGGPYSGSGHGLLPGEGEEQTGRPDDEGGREEQGRGGRRPPAEQEPGADDGEEQPGDRGRRGGEGGVGAGEDETFLPGEEKTGGEPEGDTEGEGGAPGGDVAPEGEGGEESGGEGASEPRAPDQCGGQPGGGDPGDDGEGPHPEGGHQVRRDEAVVGGVHPAVPEEVVRGIPVPGGEVGPGLLSGEVSAAGGEAAPPEGVQGERGEGREKGDAVTPVQRAEGVLPLKGRVRPLDQGEFGRGHGCEDVERGGGVYRGALLRRLTGKRPHGRRTPGLPPCTSDHTVFTSPDPFEGTAPSPECIRERILPAWLMR